MKIKKKKSGFTFIELSIVAIIIGILMASVIAGADILRTVNLQKAQTITSNSAINSIPDMIFWAETSLDEDLAEVSDGEAVSIWNDIVDDLNVTQSISDNRPTLLEEGINGLPSINFDGVDDVLFVQDGPINIGSSQYTIIVVFRPLDVDGTQTLVSQKSNGANNSESAEIEMSTNSIIFSGHSNDTSSFGSLMAGSNYIFVMKINNNNSSNVTGYLNSDSSSTLASTNNSTLELGVDFFSVGARIQALGNVLNYSHVLISEVIIYQRNLSPNEVKLINSYLSEKYNIDIS